MLCNAFVICMWENFDVFLVNDLSEGQVQDGLWGQGLEVVLPGQSQGLQEERESCGEATRLPVELSGGKHNSVWDRKGHDAHKKKMQLIPKLERHTLNIYGSPKISESIQIHK